MTLEQALQNISQLLAAYKGTLAEHNAIQQSLEIIKNACVKEEKAE